MATPITYTVGATGRQYANIFQLTADIGVGISGDLTVSDETWTIEVYNDNATAINDSFYTIQPITDTTRNIHITAAPGHSFVDNFDASTPLYPDATNGVMLQVLSGWGAYITPDCDIKYSRLQLVSSSFLINHNGTPAGNVEFDQCILRTVGTGSARLLNIRTATNVTITRCLAISESTGHPAITCYTGGILTRNTIICPSAGNTSRGVDYGAIAWNATGNCVVNFGVDFHTTSSGNYNASSDASAPGANSLHNIVLSNEFENVVNDFRKKLGATMIDAGNTSGLATDVRGITIPQNGVEDIGADEYYVSAPVGNNLLLLTNNNMGF